MSDEIREIQCPACGGDDVETGSGYVLRGAVVTLSQLRTQYAVGAAIKVAGWLWFKAVYRASRLAGMVGLVFGVLAGATVISRAMLARRAGAVTSYHCRSCGRTWVV